MVKNTCIDESTGEISLTGGVKIGPSLSKEQLLSSPLGEKAEPWGVHDPFYHCRIIAATSDGTPFVFILSFGEGKLYEVSLTYDSAEFGSSWEDWSEERERNRKAKHDEWLQKIGIDFQTYIWGKVDSLFDEQIGASSIVVTYSAHANRYSAARPHVARKEDAPF